MGTNTFHDYVVTDLLRNVPGISTRRMFGGYGLYLEDAMFGLIAHDALYFKVDEQNQSQFERYGSKPFSYQRHGQKTKLSSFWEVPADILEDTMALEDWVKASIATVWRSKIKEEARKKQPKTGFSGVKEKFHQLSAKDQDALLRDLYQISPETKALLENRLLGVASNQQQYIKEMKRETIEKIYRKGIPKEPSGSKVNSILSRAKKAGVDLTIKLQLEWLAYRGFQEYLHEFGGGPESFDGMACDHLQEYLQLVRDGIKDESEKKRRYFEAAQHIISHDNLITDYAEDTFEEVVGIRPANVESAT